MEENKMLIIEKLREVQKMTPEYDNCYHKDACWRCFERCSYRAIDRAIYDLEYDLKHDLK